MKRSIQYTSEELWVKDYEQLLNETMFEYIIQGDVLINVEGEIVQIDKAQGWKIMWARGSVSRFIKKLHRQICESLNDDFQEMS